MSTLAETQKYETNEENDVLVSQVLHWVGRPYEMAADRDLAKLNNEFEGLMRTAIKVVEEREQLIKRHLERMIPVFCDDRNSDTE